MREAGGGHGGRTSSGGSPDSDPSCSRSARATTLQPQPGWLNRGEASCKIRGSLVSRHVSAGTCYDRVAQLHQGLSQSPAVGHHLALIDSELWSHGLLQGHSNTWRAEAMGPEGRKGSEHRLRVRKHPWPPLRLPRFSVSPKGVDHMPRPQMTCIFNLTITWPNCQTSSV